LPGLRLDIRSQSIPFDQILLYDDASNDGTADLAEGMGIFTVLRGSTNIGPAGARNACIEAARGEFLHFHDADDRMLPHLNETLQLEIGDADVLIAGYQDVDLNTGAELGEPACHLDINSHPDPTRYLIEHVVRLQGLYRRRSVVAVNGLSRDLYRLGHEDPDLNIRLAASGARIRATASVITRRMIHPEGFSATRWRDCLAGARVCFTRLLRDLPSRYRTTLLHGLAVNAREADNKGHTYEADEGWRVLKDWGFRQFPSERPVMRVAGRVLGPGLLSAARNRKAGVALMRAVRGW